MKEKTHRILLITLAVLLAVSLFFNGWLIYEYAAGKDIPKNFDISPPPDPDPEPFGSGNAPENTAADEAIGNVRSAADRLKR